MAVKAPISETDDPDRERECLVALAGTFKDLTATAAKAGWSREEIAFGLLELSRHEVRSLMRLGERRPKLDDSAERNRR